MAAIFLNSLRLNWRSALFTGLGLAVIAALFSGLFDHFAGQLDTFTSFIEAMPEGMGAIIGDLAAATTPEGWLALELFPIFVPFALVILAVTLGAGLIGREEDSGTLELILASKRSRLNIARQKFLALAVLTALPAVLLFAAIWIGTLMFEFSPNLWHVAAACLGGWALGLAHGGISFAVQAVTGKRGLAIAIGTGMFAVSYTLSIVCKLIDDWKDYDIYSTMYYYNIPGALHDGADWSRLAVLGAIAVICLMVAILGFDRRDTGK